MGLDDSIKSPSLVHPDFIDGSQSPDPFRQELWTLGQVLVWIYLRDHDSLREYSKGLPWREDEWDMWVWKNRDERDEDAQLRAAKAVRDAARRELTSGRIPTWGLRNGVGDRLSVPAKVWFDGDIGFYWARHKPELCGVCVSPHQELREGYMSPSRPDAAKWHAIIARRVDAMASFPPLQIEEPKDELNADQSPKAKQRFSRKSARYWTEIDALIYEKLLDDDIPQKGDGGQAALETFAISEAEARGENPHVSTVRRHVNKMIEKRRQELILP